jgi:integrase
MKFTPKTIEHLKPRDHRVEIPDSKADGLYLILQPSGHRSWAARYRADGRSVKLTLGSWPAVSLHDAREAAAAALKQVKLGNDPAKARQDAKIAAMEAAKSTVASICAAYMKREAGKLRTADQRESILHRLIYPAIGERPIGEVKRSEIVAMLDHIEDHNGPRAADVALGVLRRIFHWHEKRSDEFRSPIIRGMARQNAVEHRRTRILSDAELRAVWLAASADSAGAFGALVKFLLLTSARRSEAAGMKWDEVDANGIWVLPSSRSKTKTSITRPLSEAALAVLAPLPRVGDYPFTLNGGVTPLISFSDPKERLDAASGVSGWRLHDTRRTARSLLSRAGVHSDIVEKCLGHSRGAIVETYDRHSFVAEMRIAFEKLATLIGSIVEPQENIIPLRR